MPTTLRRFRTLLSELKRRRVIRTVAGYSVAAGGLITFAERITGALKLPATTPDYVVIGALIGLPVVVLASWMFDLVTDTGTPATQPVPVTPLLPPAPEPLAALPSAGTAFIGRGRELSELIDLMRDPATRLVTLIGPGGSGKTRLSVSAARELEPHFEHGLRYIALSGLATPDLLAASIADSLGMTLTRRDDGGSEVVDYLRGKKLLLVLDNFEHLLTGAGLLSSIVEAAPGVRMLVTSRERLNLLTEILVPLEGLQVVAQDGSDGDAVQLFVSAARREDHHFQLDATNRDAVRRICRLVDGLPLAIELAAAWVRVMSCEEIHADLAMSFDILSSTSPDMPERHRSLRVAFNASWKRLSRVEQDAVASLSVLRSDFDRETAQAVAGADVALLRVLLDKSLLTRANSQFLMLEMIRQYAAEQLHEEPAVEAAARHRHVQYFANLLASLEHAATRWDPTAFARISEDIDDVRGAWRFATDTVDTDSLLRGTNTLFHFYDARGWGQEGAEAFARAARTVATSGDQNAERRLAHARLTLRSGGLLSRLGRHTEADALLRRGLAEARDCASTSDIMFGLHRLSGNCLMMGAYDDAQRIGEEALVLALQHGSSYEIGWSQAHLGNVSVARGEYDVATHQHTEALALLRQEGDRNGMWVAINNLGVIAGSRADYHEARRRFEEGLQLQRELGNQYSIATLLHNLGCTAIDTHEYALARAYLEEGLEMSERMGYYGKISLSLAALSDALVEQGELVDARATAMRALTIATESGNNPTTLEAMLSLVHLRIREGDRVGAARVALVVAAHPASGGNARSRARQYLGELNTEPAAEDGALDLATFAADILAGREHLHAASSLYAAGMARARDT